MATKAQAKAKQEKEEALASSNLFLHPKSRRCIAMVKKVRKDSKKEQHKKDYKLKQSLIADKMLWFQKHMDPNVCPYTVDLTAELVESYIARNDEELEQIKIKRSIGGNRNKQHIGRENAINMTKERETRDYGSCGLEIPDILNKAQCEMLRKWSGDIKFLPNFKFTKFRKSQASRVSAENTNGSVTNKIKNVPKIIITGASNDNSQNTSKSNGDSMDTE